MTFVYRANRATGMHDVAKKRPKSAASKKNDLLRRPTTNRRPVDDATTWRKTEEGAPPIYAAEIRKEASFYMGTLSPNLWDLSLRATMARSPPDLWCIRLPVGGPEMHPGFARRDGWYPSRHCRS